MEDNVIGPSPVAAPAPTTHNLPSSTDLKSICLKNRKSLCVVFNVDNPQKSQHGCGRWAPAPHPVSDCPGVPLVQCPSVPVSQYPIVPESLFPCVPVFQSPGEMEKRTRKGGTEKRTIFGTDRQTHRYTDRQTYRGS